MAWGDVAAAKTGESVRAWPTHPQLDPGLGLTMTIRQVLGLHKVRFQHLKGHEHLSQQHHKVDLKAGGGVSPWDPWPWMLTLAHQAPRWPYLEGRWHIKQVLKGQWAATRKVGGAEILHQLEVVQAVCHRHGVLEAHLCRDTMPRSMRRRREPRKKEGLL